MQKEEQTGLVPPYYTKQHLRGTGRVRVAKKETELEVIMAINIYTIKKMVIMINMYDELCIKVSQRSTNQSKIYRS